MEPRGTWNFWKVSKKQKMLVKDVALLRCFLCCFVLNRIPNISYMMSQYIFLFFLHKNQGLLKLRTWNNRKQERQCYSYVCGFCILLQMGITSWNIAKILLCYCYIKNHLAFGRLFVSPYKKSITFQNFYHLKIIIELYNQNSK